MNNIDTTPKSQSIDTVSTDSYYRWQAPLYDATRWLFLFGRKQLVGRVMDYHSPSYSPTIIEVGCGTGHLLHHLYQYDPEASLHGIEPSGPMRKRLQRKFPAGGSPNLYSGTFPSLSTQLPSADIILFSYSLTMLRDPDSVQYHLQLARQQLRHGGLLGLVDFHSTPFSWFRKWMSINHVKFDQSPARFWPVDGLDSISTTLHNAYCGWWKYSLHIARKCF